MWLLIAAFESARPQDAQQEQVIRGSSASVSGPEDPYYLIQSRSSEITDAHPFPWSLNVVL